MRYLVRLQPRAERDLESIFLYIGARQNETARRWYLGLLDDIERLSTLPNRHPRTPEDATLRHLLYGNKPHVYRVIYAVDHAAGRVNVLHVRHAARDAYPP